MKSALFKRASILRLKLQSSSLFVPLSTLSISISATSMTLKAHFFLFREFYTIDLFGLDHVSLLWNFEKTETVSNRKIW